MPSECKFFLYNRQYVYFTGRGKIEGYLALTTTSIKHVKQIRIRFIGVAKCGFDKMLMNTEKPEIATKDVYYSSQENLIKLESIVHGSGELGPLTYTWPFSFSLPKNLPTSMESQLGHIRYELSLKIYNANDKYPNIFIKPITIISNIDLNLRRDCKLPQPTVTNPINCCGLSGANTTFHFKPVYGGYVAGQELAFQVGVNHEHEDVEYQCDVYVIRSIKYKATNPRVSKLLVEHNFIANTRNSQSKFFILKLPITPPTTNTKYISIKYILRAELTVSCCTHTIKAEVPLLIGTVPLADCLMPGQKYSRLPRANTFITEPSGYAESTLWDKSFVDRQTDELHRIDDFKPSYPIYETRKAPTSPDSQ